MTNTVTIGVASREEINARFMRAMTTGKRTAPFIGFADERALWSTLTPLRWDILKAMTGAGPLELREIARRVGRDVRGVHTSVHALLAVGLIERDEAGFRFPYDAVHVDFVLRAACSTPILSVSLFADVPMIVGRMPLDQLLSKINTDNNIEISVNQPNLFA